jgi:hypothetical protein
MLEEPGFERKQARVHGMSGKAWIGIRTKTHDELVKDAGGTESEETSARPIAETSVITQNRPYVIT